MSGKCFACSSAFGFFKKEHGCKNCGFAFCSNCLPHKEPVPKHNNQRLPVCINCHLILTGKKKQKDPTQFTPPEALKKRLAALDDTKEPQRTAITRPKGTSSKGKLSGEDAALEERLLKLKEERKKAAKAATAPDQQKDTPAAPLSSDQEMAERLAKLKGVPPESQRPPQPFPTEKRSEQQQIDDLLMQISDEVQIDAKFNEDKSEEEPLVAGGGEREEDLGVDEVHRLIKKAADEAKIDAEKATESLKNDDELWSRLQQLKEERKKKGGGKSIQEEDEEEEEEDEEAASLKIIHKLLAEHKLDEQSGMTPDEEDNDELPWCCICNENATLRCHGCDEDLYCQRCFREGHSAFEMSDHTTESYTRKK